MATISGFIESQFDTDFAILIVSQPDSFDAAESGSFVGSAPGCLSMMAGTKNALMSVRVELWDALPPVAGDDWEDRDEIPWESVLDEGPISLSGFEPVDCEELHVPAGRYRVEVLARGRHRYGYSDDRYATEEGVAVPHEPEHWLLRIWPDPARRNALAGPPRRIAGALPFRYKRSPWHAALHGWELSGWSLPGADGFRTLEQAISAVHAPFTPDRLLEMWTSWGAPQSGGGYTWDSSVFGARRISSPLAVNDGLEDHVAALAAAAGMESLTTLRDAFECLLRLGLIAQLNVPGGPLFVPNGSPPANAWDVLPGGRRRFDPDTKTIGYDIGNLWTWAPGWELRTTPEAIAVRLAVPVEDVISALGHVAAGGLLVTPDPQSLTVDSAVTVRRRVPST